MKYRRLKAKIALLIDFILNGLNITFPMRQVTILMMLEKSVLCRGFFSQGQVFRLNF